MLKNENQRNVMSNLELHFFTFHFSPSTSLENSVPQCMSIKCKAPTIAPTERNLTILLTDLVA